MSRFLDAAHAPRACPQPLWWVALVIVMGCGPAASDWTRLDPPRDAVDFTLSAMDGGPVTLSDLRGRVVIMEFWATWCPSCRSSTPSLEVIYRRYRDQGVTVLLINEGEPAEEVRAWAGKRFTAPILLDGNGEVGRRYGVDGVPQLFLVDQEGRVLYHEQGYRGGLEQNLKLILEELLRAAPEASHA